MLQSLISFRLEVDITEFKIRLRTNTRQSGGKSFINWIFSLQEEFVNFVVTKIAPRLFIFFQSTTNLAELLKPYLSSPQDQEYFSHLQSALPGNKTIEMGLFASNIAEELFHANKSSIDDKDGRKLFFFFLLLLKLFQLFYLFS